MRDKFIQMRPLLKDKNVISDCETQIREYQKYIDYFTEELTRLQAKQDADNTNTDSPSQHMPKSEHPPRTSSMATTGVMPTVINPQRNNKKKYSNLGNFFKKKLIKCYHLTLLPRFINVRNPL